MRAEKFCCFFGRHRCSTHVDNDQNRLRFLGRVGKQFEFMVVGRRVTKAFIDVDVVDGGRFERYSGPVKT